MIATFCGHGTVVNKNDVRAWLYTATENLIFRGVKTFYLGGYGEFDNLAKSVLREHKKCHSYIEIALILPYLNNGMDKAGYCYALYPPIEAVPKRFAISKRNEWMVNQSEIVLAYVTHSWGGAAKTLEFAQRKNKHIIIYAPSTQAQKPGK